MQFVLKFNKTYNIKKNERGQVICNTISLILL